MSTFTQAAISYHGIPPDVVVRSDLSTGDDGVLYLTVQIPIKEGEFEPIVKRMLQMTEHAQQEEPVFVPDDLNMQQWRDDYAALSQAERGKYKSFQRYKAVRQLQQQEQEIAEALSEQSEGVGGRKVQHVDAPEQEAESELPAAVWVRDPDLMRSQVGMASDTRNKFGIGPEYLLQVDMLTPEQKAKYCGEQK